MSTPEQIYRTFIAEEADASRQRNRPKTPLDISTPGWGSSWRGMLHASMKSSMYRLHRELSRTHRLGYRIRPIVKYFLEKPEKQIPLATANVGYHPGETR